MREPVKTDINWWYHQTRQSLDPEFSCAQSCQIINYLFDQTVELITIASSQKCVDYPGAPVFQTWN